MEIRFLAHNRAISICLFTIVTFCVSWRCFRRWGTVCARSFFWSTSRGPDGILPGATEVHLTPVARVMATESRRNWLYSARSQFRKNWSRRLLFFCFAGHFVRDRVLCVANIQATQMHVRPFTCLQQRRSQQTTSQ